MGSNSLKKADYFVEYVGKEGKKAKIKVFEKMCKGCEICVEFCPVKILELKGLVVTVNNPDKCTKCFLCEKRCPDFAITVE